VRRTAKWLHKEVEDLGRGIARARTNAAAGRLKASFEALSDQEVAEVLAGIEHVYQLTKAQNAARKTPHDMPRPRLMAELVPEHSKAGWEAWTERDGPDSLEAYWLGHSPRSGIENNWVKAGGLLPRLPEIRPRVRTLIAPTS
jgi:hypothetical protein